MPVLRARRSLKQPEKDDVVVADQAVERAALEQRRRGWLAARQAAITPDRHEARLGTRQRLVKPVVVLAAFPGAVDERAGEHIGIFHHSSLAELEPIAQAGQVWLSSA